MCVARLVIFAENIRERDIDCEHQSSCNADDSADLQSGSLVGENYFVLAGACFDSHKAVVYFLDIDRLTIDCCAPAVAVGDTEKYKLRLIERYFGLESVTVIAE